MRIIEVPEERRFLLSSTSKGNQIKWFYNNEYLKADSMGYEGLAEAFVSELESRIVNPDFCYVDYQMCIIREISSDSGDSTDYTGCRSKNMLHDGEFLLSVYRMLETRYSKNKVNSILNGYGREIVDFVLGMVEEVTSIKSSVFRTYLAHMLMLDAIVLNEDRHLGNISLIKSVNGGYRLSPIFDNGLSLMSDTLQYRFDKPYLINIRKVKSRPFSSSFLKQLGYFEGEPLLLIKDANFISDIVASNYDIGENEVAFNRAKVVLKNRLNALKGVAWEDA